MPVASFSHLHACTFTSSKIPLRFVYLHMVKRIIQLQKLLKSYPCHPAFKKAFKKKFKGIQ